MMDSSMTAAHSKFAWLWRLKTLVIPINFVMYYSDLGHKYYVDIKQNSVHEENEEDNSTLQRMASILKEVCRLMNITDHLDHV